MMKLGIIGIGKLGTVLGQLATKAGYTVYIAGSGEPPTMIVETLVPGAQAVTAAQAADYADVVILAIPLNQYKKLPAKALAGKLVIDATNYWWEIDGPRNDILPTEQSSSEAVQEFLPDARIVKAFNHMGYHDLYDETRPSGAPDRKAIAIAGDNSHDIDTVSYIVDGLGFDPLFIGSLSSGRKLEPGGKAFGADVDTQTLSRLVLSTK